MAKMMKQIDTNKDKINVKDLQVVTKGTLFDGGVEAIRYQSKTDETKFFERHIWHEKHQAGEAVQTVRNVAWYAVDNPDVALGQGCKDPRPEDQRAPKEAKPVKEKKIKEPKGPKGRKAHGPFVFATTGNYPVGPFSIWAGAQKEQHNGFGYKAEEIVALFASQGIDVNVLNPEPIKFVNDRLWRGRFEKNTPPNVSAEDAAATLKFVESYRATAAERKEAEIAAKAEKAIAERTARELAKATKQAANAATKLAAKETEAKIKAEIKEKTVAKTSAKTDVVVARPNNDDGPAVEETFEQANA